jgi:probable phosphomutase (TIGR03848 family)
VLLVRHGLTTLTGSVLAGWLAGVNLDDRGAAQARSLAARLAPVPLDAIISSPLDRCTQTAAAIAAARDGRPEAAVRIDERLGECHYGDWTSKPLKKLAKDPLWRVVQLHASAARFPGPDGEAIADMQHRAVRAVRDWNDTLGPDARYVICSHGDVIKAIVADSLGVHLDLFQRIQVDPCSLTVIKYTELRPFLLRLNDTGGSVADLLPADAGTGADQGQGGSHGSPEESPDKQGQRKRGRPGRSGRRSDSDAIIGGGAGADGAAGASDVRQQPAQGQG